MAVNTSYYSYSIQNEVTLLILLPNYFVEEITVNKKSSLLEIKELVLKEIKTNEGYENDSPLREKFSSYIFCGINKDAEIEEYYDESQLLCNLNLIDFVLNCLERKGNKIESQLTAIINHCIGVTLDNLSKPISESFMSELVFSRKAYLDIAKEEYENILKNSLGVLNFQYSADYNEYITLASRHILQSMDYLHITSYIHSGISDKQKISFLVGKDATVKDTICKILFDNRNIYGYDGVEDLKLWLSKNIDKNVLKVSSLESYLINGNNKLIFYDYVQSCLYNYENPVLSLYNIEQLNNIAITQFFIPSYYYQNMPQSKKERYKLDTENDFMFTIQCAQLMCRDSSKLYVRAAIFNGAYNMITSEVKSESVYNDRPSWNQKMKFNVKYIDIPRNARLCISLIQKNDRRGNEIVRGWANVNIYDYFGYLIEGSMDLNLSSSSDNSYYNPFGTTYSVKSNCDIVLCVEFAKLRNNYYHEPLSTLTKVSDTSNETIAKIKRIIEVDLLSEISEQDIDFLRMNAQHCLRVPDSIPRLAKSIRWSNRDDVGTFYFLLSKWPKINLESSLQLLGCDFFDSKLRGFAVRNLSNILNEADLTFYLLQLIQALKCESYIFNDLSIFLIRNALKSKQLGQKLFWYLKSDIHNNSVKIHFAVMLEAFSRGYWNFTTIIKPQCQAIEKFTELSTLIKSFKDEEQLANLREFMSQDNFKDSFENFYSLIYPPEKVGSIVVNNCDVKKSKKRPLFIEWRNPDIFSDLNPSIKYIFKHGDDLRQDMLTLQLFAIFDWIWKRQFQDMKLLPYGCLSTGNCIGIIEVVKDAETVMSIQKKYLSAAIQMNPSSLYKWIKYHNTSPEKMQRALETFTRSCAGYSVATFILGIRDRHPDNIMVNTKGQLFHIDFGHILDNTKKKFGINRERVPFVLTEDFIYVIADDCDKTQSKDYFVAFQKLCGDAYLKLREHSSLILTLFTLMIPSKLPELTGLNDLEYLRKTLQVESTEEKALAYFNTQFSKSISKSWTTKIDWLSHWIKN